MSATHVDATSGNDLSGTGSSALPYKSITHALSRSASGSVLVVHPGIYDASSGEVFPIVLPPGTSLSGAVLDITSGIGAVIRGAGSFTSPSVPGNQAVAVVTGSGTEISLIVIESPSGTAVWDESAAGQSTLSNSVIRNSQTGVVVAGGSSSKLNKLTVIGNISSGVEVLGTASPILSQNLITGNGVGMSIQQDANPRFNVQGSPGNNTLNANSACDLQHLGNADVNAVGTNWDDDVFNFAITNVCTGGANIVVVQGLGSVDFQFIPSQVAPLFPGSTHVSITSPTFGQLIFSGQPSLSWITVSPRLSALAIWDRPPEIGAEGIVNKGDIKWMWHSGLETGIPGFVQFSDGVQPINGSILQTGPPIPLVAGRSYYLAAWEWDPSGTAITVSTNVSYFRVSN